MILNTYNEAASDITDELESMTGDPIELAEAATELLTETHNLTLAMARFEHSLYLSEAAEPEKEEKKQGAVGAYFSKMVAHVVEFWKKIKAWLIHAYETIKMKVFGPRKSWLEKYGSAIKGPYGDAKASVGSQMKASVLSRLFVELTDTSDNLVADAEAASTGGDRGNFQARMQATVSKWLHGSKADESVVKQIEERYIGAVKEVAITDSLVSEMKGAAEATFANVEKLKQVNKVCDAAIREASAYSRAQDADKEKAGRLRNLAAVGPKVSAMVGAATSANSRANAMAMAALVKAHNAGGGEKKPAEGTPAPAAKKGKVEKQNADTSVLDAFM